MMAGQRVLVSGMGSELGSLVASMLEAEPWVGPLQGIDVDPPRRRLRKAEFYHIDPADHARVIDTVTRFDPHVLVHIAVWEPDARARPRAARRLTDDAAISILGAAADCPSLEHVIVRSGTEIYGRRRGALTRPDEDAPIAPTTQYGQMVADIEATAQAIGKRVGVAIGALRFASIIGRHVPSPLGRMLRQPAVPFSALADPPFGVVHDGDAAAAFVAAARRRVVGPINVVAPGSVTALQAIRRGKRIPIPLAGPEWGLANRLSHLFGAPIPDHVVEMLNRGRLADASRCREVLGIEPEFRTIEVIDQVFAWPSIVRVPPRVEVA
jgi:UDP-glucose 4-epimerase